MPGRNFWLSCSIRANVGTLVSQRTDCKHSVMNFRAGQQVI